MDPEVKKKSGATQRVFRPSVVKGANASGGISGELPPTVILEPLNATSGSTKHLELFEKIRIGRQVSPKTEPSPANGFFNSKVLSRAHAEIWYENGTVYIKDAKSSNGTYLNSVRLSGEGLESPPHKLNSGDLLEFGVDILNTGGEALYHRVSCKVQINFQTPQVGSVPPTSNPEISGSKVDDAPQKEKEKAPSSDLSKIYNPIPHSSGSTTENLKQTVIPLTQATAVVAPITLNASSTVIPKAILGSLQDEARLATQESEELAGMLNTVTELMSTYQQQISQLRSQESQKILQLTQEIAQKEALYQRLEISSSKRETHLIEESKLHLQQLHSQRQSNQKLLTENSNLFVALMQHCPEFSEHTTPEKVLGNCLCQDREARILTSAIKHYENELAKSLANNLELKAENEKYRDCLKALSQKVEAISVSIPSSQKKPNGPVAPTSK